MLSILDFMAMMITAIALVISYFSGPVLNFGDFSRYCKDFQAVKRGNFWGLPVNFLAFSLVTVVTTSATLPVFGKPGNILYPRRSEVCYNGTWPSQDQVFPSEPIILFILVID
jgi:cytosine/uracil/thiamine/allantoin permease